MTDIGLSDDYILSDTELLRNSFTWHTKLFDSDSMYAVGLPFIRVVNMSWVNTVHGGRASLRRLPCITYCS